MECGCAARARARTSAAVGIARHKNLLPRKVRRSFSFTPVRFEIREARFTLL